MQNLYYVIQYIVDYFSFVVTSFNCIFTCCIIKWFNGMRQFCLSYCWLVLIIIKLINGRTLHFKLYIAYQLQQLCCHLGFTSNFRNQHVLHVRHPTDVISQLIATTYRRLSNTYLMFWLMAFWYK